MAEHADPRVGVGDTFLNDLGDIFRATVPAGTAYALERVTQFRSFGSRSMPDVRLEQAPSNKIAGPSPTT